MGFNNFKKSINVLSLFQFGYFLNDYDINSKSTY